MKAIVAVKDDEIKEVVLVSDPAQEARHLAMVRVKWHDITEDEIEAHREDHPDWPTERIVEHIYENNIVWSQHAAIVELVNVRNAEAEDDHAG